MLILAPLFALAAVVGAFPGFAGGVPRHRSERSSHKTMLSARDPAGSPELEPVAVVDGLKRVPDDDHPFQAPGPTDRRGPCPGLNTLANHGIPRSGIVTGDEIIEGSVEGLGMGADIVMVLIVLSLAYDGDLLSGKFSIGAPDNRTAGLGPLQNILSVAGGLNYHNTLEGDASSTRQDAYFGDGHSMDPNLYLQMKSIAAQHGGTYGFDTMKEVLQMRYDDSLARNPTFYWLPIAALVPLGSKGLVPVLFSNGTYGAGGVPNEASISSFFGARALPDGRYDARDDCGFILSTNVPFGANAGHPDTFIPFELGALTDVNGLACFLLTALQANIPSILVQPLRDVVGIVGQVLDKITPMFEQFGCPTYNATQAQTYKDLSKCNTFGPPVSQD
ncbi:heme-thiolate peroxidase [Dentipellis fragilis]|uniref:Heme-thiolate peroxidase n=1 Tax=Dentipellis fragilis TaxID=205917 RepID=A0A4Y9XQQ3_9AGAM|nr:heme-thiolate peroxidase [Dentipellis fragilis]